MQCDDRQGTLNNQELLYQTGRVMSHSIDITMGTANMLLNDGMCLHMRHLLQIEKISFISQKSDAKHHFTKLVWEQNVKLLNCLASKSTAVTLCKDKLKNVTSSIYDSTVILT